MTVLSLFDGMGCGVLAMMESGVNIDRYVAYEIDKYAIKTSQHNFPFIEHRGDVFKADFTEFEGFDWLIAGFPCTKFSIAQKNDIPQPQDRGILLKDILEDGCCVDKDKAYCLKHQAGNARDYFKKHHTQIKLEPVAPCGQRNQEKSRTITAGYQTCSERDRRMDIETDGFMGKQGVAEPVPINVIDDGDKARCLMAGYYKYGTATLITNEGFKGGTTAVGEPVFIGEVPEHKGTYRNGKQASQQYRVYDTNAKGVAVTTCAITNVAEPVRVGCLPSPDGEVKNSQAFRVYDSEGKSVNLSANGGGAGGKTGLYAVPVNTTVDEKSHTIKAQYYKNGMADFITNPGHDASAVAEPLNVTPEGKSQTIKAQYQQTSPANILGYTSTYGASGVAEHCPCFAIPTEWDEEGRPTKARSCADGKIYTVYEAKDGNITIKGKEYPIKLHDDFYIIRKLTVRECMRLQTVPEWYEFPVSDSQAYKMLGNGWTVLCISHIINCALR